MRSASKRVALVIQAGTYGGAHNQARRLAVPLREAGFESLVITSIEPGGAAERLTNEGIPVTRLPLRRVRAGRKLATALYLATLPAQVLRLARAYRRLDIDVVQVHGITNVDVALAAAVARVPVVWQLLDTRAPRVLATMLRPFLRLARAILVTGRNTATAHGIDPERSHRVVPYVPPVPGASPLPTSRRAMIRRGLGVPAGAVLVGTLGNLNPQKNHELLIDAFGSAWGSASPTESLRIRGGVSPGHEGYAEHLKRRARDLTGEEAALASLEEDLAPMDFIGALDVFVLSSSGRSEGLPTAIIEAMMMGIPVVATDVGGVRDLVDNGVTGRVVPPGDAAALVDALRALAADARARTEMGAAGASRAAKELSIDRTVSSYLRAYALALKESDRA